MKKTKLMVILCLVALFFSSCMPLIPSNEMGIIEKATCSRAVFYEFESLEERYLKLTFHLTLNDDAYIGKNVEIVAVDSDSKDIYRNTFVVSENLSIDFSYSEHHPLSFQELNKNGVTTKRLMVYHDGSIVGSVDISNINIVFVI